MARGTETGMARFALVAQLARELPESSHDAREVADLARWLLRAQATLYKVRDRKFSGMATAQDEIRVSKIWAHFARLHEQTGIEVTVEQTTARMFLKLPSGEGNGAERGKWEVR